jgi:hypothetical protein
MHTHVYLDEVDFVVQLSVRIASLGLGYKRGRHNPAKVHVPCDRPRVWRMWRARPCEQWTKPKWPDN